LEFSTAAAAAAALRDGVGGIMTLLEGRMKWMYENVSTEKGTCVL